MNSGKANKQTNNNKTKKMQTKKTLGFLEQSHKFHSSNHYSISLCTNTLRGADKHQMQTLNEQRQCSPPSLSHSHSLCTCTHTQMQTHTHQGGLWNKILEITDSGCVIYSHGLNTLLWLPENHLEILLTADLNSLGPR